MTTASHPERDLVLDLAYGELPEREARRLRAHLETCADCRAELERIEGTRRLMSALPLEAAPERGERILLAAAREAAGRARPRWRVPGWLAGSLALAATVVVVTAVSLRIAGESAGPRGTSGNPNALLPTPPPAEARKADDALAKAAPAATPPPARRPLPPPAAAQRYAEPPPAVALEEKLQKREAPRPSSGQAAGALKAPPPAQSIGRVGSAAPDRDLAAQPADEGLAGRSDEPALAAAPAPAAVAPAPAAEAEMEAPRAGVAKRAAPSAAGGAAASDLARANATAGPAPAAADVRSFPGCAGESRREIGRDAGGRVIRYAREGIAGGHRVRVELTFGPDGRRVSTAARDLDTGAALPVDALPGLPRSAAEVDAGAAPRCGP